MVISNGYWVSKEHSIHYQVAYMNHYEKETYNTEETKARARCLCQFIPPDVLETTEQKDLPYLNRLRSLPSDSGVK